MDDKQEMQLVLERDLGVNAGHAWEGYFKPFFEEKQEILIEAFRVCGLRDEEGLLKIKMQFSALDSLRDELLGYMETGRLADISLNELETEKSKHKERHNG